MPHAIVGVYANYQRETAVVIQHDESTVWYIALDGNPGMHAVMTRGHERFLREYIIHYENYPILRAIRHLRHGMLPSTPQAKAVIDKIYHRLTNSEG